MEIVKLLIALHTMTHIIHILYTYYTHIKHILNTYLGRENVAKKDQSYDNFIDK